MKFQVVSILLLAICASGHAQASAGATAASAPAPVGPPSFCQIHLNILQSEANKINTPDLPEDLRLRLDAVLENAALGCADCEGVIIWLNKVCLVVNLRSGLTQLSIIKAEADARAAAPAVAVL